MKKLTQVVLGTAFGGAAIIGYSLFSSSQIKEYEPSTFECSKGPISSEKINKGNGIENRVFAYCNDSKTGKISRMIEEDGNDKSIIYFSYLDEFGDVASIRGNIKEKNIIYLKFYYPIKGGTHVVGNNGCGEIKGNLPPYVDQKRIVSYMKRLFLPCDSPDRNLLK